MLEFKEKKVRKAEEEFKLRYKLYVFTAIQEIFGLSDSNIIEYYQKYFNEVTNSSQNGTDFFWCKPGFYLDERVLDVYKALALSRALSLDNTWSKFYAKDNPIILKWYQDHSRDVFGQNMSQRLLNTMISLLKINKQLVVELSDNVWIIDQYNNLALLLLESIKDKELSLSALDGYDFIPNETIFASNFVALLKSDTLNITKVAADEKFRKAITISRDTEQTRLAKQYVYAVNESIVGIRFPGSVPLRHLNGDEISMFCSQLKFLFKQNLLDKVDTTWLFIDVEIYFLLTDASDRCLRKDFFLHLSDKENLRYRSENFNDFTNMISEEFSDDRTVMAKLMTVIRRHNEKMEIKQQEKIAEQVRKREEMKNDPLRKLYERLSN